MKKSFPIFALLFSLFCSSSALADDGNELLEKCSASIKALDQGFDKLDRKEHGRSNYCLGFIGGITDGHGMLTAIEGNKPIFCPPDDGVENEQLIRIVHKWFSNHPGELNNSARLLVFVAVADAFPCGEKIPFAPLAPVAP